MYELSFMYLLLKFRKLQLADKTLKDFAAVWILTFLIFLWENRVTRLNFAARKRSDLSISKTKQRRDLTSFQASFYTNLNPHNKLASFLYKLHFRRNGTNSGLRNESIAPAADYYYKKGDKGGVFDVPPIRQAWNGSLSWTKQSSLIYEIK